MKKILFGSALTLLSFSCSHPQSKTQNTEVYNVAVQKMVVVDQNENGSYIGSVEASVTIPLSFQMSGLVKSVLVSEGEAVKKGQLLAVLDSSSAFNAYQVAEAKERQTQDAFNRLETVYKNGSLTEIKWVEIQTGLDQAQALKRLAFKNYTDCKMYSPTNGYIGKRNFEPGMNSTPGITAFDLVKIEQVLVSVSVPENEISQIKKGQKATVEIAALGDELFLGVIEETGVVADFASHTYKVKIAVNNRELKLKPGMVGNVNLENNSNLKIPVVPLRAVLTDETDAKYVFIAGADNKAVKKYVKLGKLLNDGVAITEGLNPNDRIIVEGNHKLAQNSQIKITNPAE